MDNNVKMVPVQCSNCGGMVEVSEGEETAKCPFCGTTFVIEKAAGDSINFDVNGALKDVLGFVGDQMKESRQERREQKKVQAENDRLEKRNMFRIFGIMFALMIAASVVMYLVMYFTGGLENDTDTTTVESEDSVIECRIENGCLNTDITGPNLAFWKYSDSNSYGTTLVSEYNNIDHYESCVSPARKVTEGEYYVVTAAYEDDFNWETSTPLYYTIVKVTIEDSEIVEATQPVSVYSLSEYDFQ